MAQAAMRNKAVAAEAKKVEQAVIAEALAAAADKPARHKETETEVALLRTRTLAPTLTIASILTLAPT